MQAGFPGAVERVVAPIPRRILRELRKISRRGFPGHGRGSPDAGDGTLGRIRPEAQAEGSGWVSTVASEATIAEAGG